MWTAPKSLGAFSYQIRRKLSAVFLIRIFLAISRLMLCPDGCNFTYKRHFLDSCQIITSMLFPKQVKTKIGLDTLSPLNDPPLCTFWTPPKGHLGGAHLHLFNFSHGICDHFCLFSKTSRRPRGHLGGGVVSGELVPTAGMRMVPRHCQQSSSGPSPRFPLPAIGLFLDFFPARSSLHVSPHFLRRCADEALLCVVGGQDRLKAPRVPSRCSLPFVGRRGNLSVIVYSLFARNLMQSFCAIGGSPPSIVVVGPHRRSTWLKII